MKKGKKAQLQLGENVVVLIIFFFLLVIAVVFYSGIQKSRFKSTQVEFDNAAFLDLKTTVGAMPEILCKENNDITEGCIDVINLGMMKLYWESIKWNLTSLERDYYINRFGASEIVVKELNPLTGQWINSWTLYNNTDEMVNYSSSPAFIPVSLYNATTDGYTFGVVYLKRFSRI